MIDPLNTTEGDGAPCAFCGDDATGLDTVSVQGRMAAIPTCTSCHWDQLTACPRCETVIRQTDGVRVGADLWCQPCAKQDAAITRAYIEAHKADEQRDDFNMERR